MIVVIRLVVLSHYVFLLVKKICEHKIGVFVYKSLNQLCPSYLRNFHFDHAHFHEYKTRIVSLLVNDIGGSARGEFCVLKSGVKARNRLLKRIRESENQFCLKID